MHSIMHKVPGIVRAFLPWFVVLFVFVPPYFRNGTYSFTRILCGVLVILCFLSSYKFFRKIRIFSAEFFFIIWMLYLVFVHIFYGFYHDALWNLLYLLVVMIVAEVAVDHGVFIRIVDLIVFTTGFVCLLGLVEGITGFNPWLLFNTSGSEIFYNPPRFGLTRIISFTYQTITYSTFLILAGSLVFYRASQFTNRRKQKLIVLYWIIYALVWINVILTLSRSSLMVFIIVQIVLLFLSYGLKQSLIILGIIFIFGAAFLLIVSLINETAAKMIFNVYYMILAVFDSSYTEKIAESFGTDNLEATDTRIALFGWVMDASKGKYLFGAGPFTEFNYEYTISTARYTWSGVKQTIEIMYLNTLFHYGFVGVVLQVTSLIAALIASIKNAIMKCAWDSKPWFGIITSVALGGLLIQYFAVPQSSEMYLLYVIFGLIFSYRRCRLRTDVDILHSHPAVNIKHEIEKTK